MPPPASAVAASVSPARARQEDLEGERSPGRTVLALSVTNPVRTARTRRWSKALKRPTLPVEPGSASTRKGGGGSAAVPGARPVPGELAVTSVVEEAPGDVWRSAEQSVGQSPSNRRGRPVSLSGCESGRVVPGGRWNRRRATAAVTRCGCRRGDSSRGTKSVAGMAMRAAAGLSGRKSGTLGNATNPRIGSRLQYACDYRGRQTAEVVRNHVSGSVPGVASRDVPTAATLAGPNPKASRWRGVPTNPKGGG